MSPEVYSVLILGFLAVALLVADRLYRIQPFLVKEGFYSGSYSRCGVDLPPLCFWYTVHKRYLHNPPTGSNS